MLQLERMAEYQRTELFICHSSIRSLPGAGQRTLARCRPQLSILLRCPRLSGPHYGFVDVEAMFCGLKGPTRGQGKIASVRHRLATLTVKLTLRCPFQNDSGFDVRLPGGSRITVIVHLLIMWEAASVRVNC